jgi:glyoxylase-like metal-dependent hydrolase (beta-lactamase superfamily II)
MSAITVGDLIVQPIFDGTAVLASSLWTGSDWSAHRHLLRDDDTMLVPVGAFLVRVGDRLVLLDAGVGDVRDEMFDGGQLLHSLSAIGVQPSDIDTVVISHLHSDHMGWLEVDGQITFSNATVHIGAADWQHFVDEAQGGRRRAERLRTIEDHVQLIELDGTTIAPGITTRATPGHTPGHTSTVISSGTERLIVLGDALHCPAQLTEPEWQFLYDVDPQLAVHSRQALLREAEADGTSVLPCHFPGMQAARLLPATGERHWVLTGS